MPTSKDSPTPGETTADVTGSSPDQPLISDGVVTSDTMSGHKPARVEVSPGNPDGLAATPSDPPQDVSGDYEKQNPEPVDEELEDDVEALQEAEKEAEVEAGQTWAQYNGSTVHMRGLTHNDQVGMGVPETATLDNSVDAKPTDLLTPLERGLWWTKRNRFRVDITDAHPALVTYIEQDDDQFAVTRY